ncbi:hypothetical protein HDZ31DRAFT_60528 [Schizophyllum fasciatum]
MDEDREGRALGTLPEDIVLHILAICSVPDILSVRCTCSRLRAITQQNILWITLLRTALAPASPLPPDAAAADDPERVVKHYARVARAWLRPRAQPPRSVLAARGGREPLLGLELVRAAWLLVVRAGAADVWHVGARRAAVLGGAAGARWTSYAAAAEGARDLVVVLADGTSGQGRAAVFRVPLRVPGGDVRPTAAFATVPIDGTVQALDPATRQIASSRPGAVDVVRYPPPSASDSMEAAPAPLQRASIATERDGGEELWNGVLAVRFVREHVLVVRARSVQVYANPLCAGAPPAADPSPSHPAPRSPHPAPHPAPCVQHVFPGHSFRQVSLSALTPRPAPSAAHTPDADADTYDLRLLANEVLQGLFLFHLTLVFPPRADVAPGRGGAPGDGRGSAPYADRGALYSASALLPTLDVRLLGVYPMSLASAPANRATGAPANRGVGALAVKPPRTRSGLLPAEAAPGSRRDAVARPPASDAASTPSFPASSAPTPSFPASSDAPRPPVFPPAAPHPTSHHIPAPALPVPTRPREHEYRAVSARGFVSAFALGARARRAVWVERRRGSTLREIFAWDWQESMLEATPGEEAGEQDTSLGISAGKGEDEPTGPADEEARDEYARAPGHNQTMRSRGVALLDLPDDDRPREMTGVAVYTRESYDLRDDITHCAFSETEGIILFGTRAGAVFLLSPGYRA